MIASSLWTRVAVDPNRCIPGPNSWGLLLRVAASSMADTFVTILIIPFNVALLLLFVAWYSPPSDSDYAEVVQKLKAIPIVAAYERTFSGGCVQAVIVWMCILSPLIFFVGLSWISSIGTFSIMVVVLLIRAVAYTVDHLPEATAHARDLASSRGDLRRTWATMATLPFCVPGFGRGLGCL